MRFLPVYGLVILMVFLIGLFSVLLPDTFPTMLNLRALISDKAIIALLSLGAMIPMAAGRIDLTVGYGIVLWHILAISLQTMVGLPWPVAVISVLMLGAFTGFLNGLLVEVAKIDSFIATLGTGTVLYAWRCGIPAGGRWSVCCRRAFTTYLHNVRLRPAHHRVLPDRDHHRDVGRPRIHARRSIPLRRWREPTRRATQRHVPTRKYVIGAFVASGVLTALAGIILASKLRIGQASVGLEFLLPALVGAFLGSTTIKPGRVNVWGTIVGVAILAVGISGIQQFGGSFWVEPLFNGVTLLIAIGIAGYAQRRKGAAKR